MPRYYEDLAVGDVYETSGYTVTKSEIVDFAEQFDPQPFHVDEAAAAHSKFGGLIASGLHTMAVCQRLVTDGFYSEIANVAGLGIDETRFHEPVRLGDRLTAHIEISETRPLEHRDDRGLVVVDQRLDDGGGTTVLTSSALTLVERI